MKPAQIKAQNERLAKVKMRQWARRIPDNAILARVLLTMERPLRVDFLRAVRPFLRFKPISLEALEGNG